MLEVCAASICIYTAFILPKKMVRPERWLGLHGVRGAAIAQEDRAVASSIGGPSYRIMVGRVIFELRRSKVNPITAV